MLALQIFTHTDTLNINSLSIHSVIPARQFRKYRFCKNNDRKGVKIMKKLLSIAFVITSMMFVASSANAQTRNNQRNTRADQQNNQTYHQNNRGVVRTYTETKNVRIRNKHYVETYQVQVFRNGKTTSKLISRVEVNNRRGNDNRDQRGVKTSYQTKTIWENGKKYKVTYKITKLSNGRTTSTIVKKVRV
jgi:hypothetical protein